MFSVQILSDSTKKITCTMTQPASHRRAELKHSTSYIYLVIKQLHLSINHKKLIKPFLVTQKMLMKKLITCGNFMHGKLL